MGLSDNIRDWAIQAGLDAVAIASVDPLLEAEQATLERHRQGHLAGMDWFTEERARAGCHPADLLPGARSVIVLAKCYLPPGSQRAEAPVEPHGKIARYAWGEDYHELVPRMVDELVGYIATARGSHPNARVFVDGGPLAEKALGARSGIGWTGKNSLLITPDYGSWVVLAEIVSDLRLKPDDPSRASCGECRLCVDHCPTGALIAPYTVDATRCISYLTIEHRGSIPRELRPKLDNWIFGCDVCQEVCPHNRLVRPTEDPVFAADRELGPYPSLDSLIAMDGERFRYLFGHSPIRRAKRRGLLRNVAVALGNSRDPACIPPLAEALADEEVLVRSHAAWGLGRIAGRRARLALEDALAKEGDEVVREEIRLALDK